MNVLCVLEEKVCSAAVGNIKLVDNVVQGFPVLTDFLQLFVHLSISPFSSNLRPS